MIKEKGYIPVRFQKNSNKNQNNTFDDGTDIGMFIAYNIDSYKTNKMSEEKRKIWIEFLKYIENFEKRTYLNKIIKMYYTVIETNNIISYKTVNNPVYKFSDGSNMYFFITSNREKIKNNKASKFESWLFNKFMDFQDKFKFKLKAKVAIQNIIELERYPTTDGQNKSRKFIRKFSNGNDIGLWLRSTFQKIRENKIEKNILPMAEELMTLDFNKIKKWNYGYNELIKYYETNTILNNNDSFNLNAFMEENIATYNSFNKSLQDEVHMDMIEDLNPNWVEDYKINIKDKSKSFIKK